MTSLAPLLAFFALGALARASGRAPEGLGSSLNWWILNLALPALLLELIPGLGFDVQYWFLVVAMWLVFAGAWAGAVLLGRLLHWSRERVGAVTLMAGLGNCTFIGYPMIEALHGRDGLALAVIADQLGVLFVLTVGATLVAASCSGRDPQPLSIAHRILVFPPFLAVLAGLVAGRIGPWPLVFQDVLSAVAATLTPLALFSVGLRFRPGLAPRHLGPVGAVLAWKMLLAPAAVLGLGWAAGITGLTLTVGVLQAAMGPMITAAIIADQHGLESEVINTSLGAGVLLTFLTVPAWNMIL